MHVYKSNIDSKSAMENTVKSNGIKKLNREQSLPSNRFYKSAPLCPVYPKNFLLPDTPKKPEKRHFRLFFYCFAITFIVTLGAWCVDNFVRPSRHHIPIARPMAPLKKIPLDHKGMKILYLDKRVYSVIATPDKGKIPMNHLLPKPEEPLYPTINITLKNAYQNNMSLFERKASESVKKRASFFDKGTVTKKHAAFGNAGGSQLLRKWRIQLASMHNSISAKQIIAASMRKYPILRRYRSYIETTTVRGTTYYRVQIVGFKSQSAARAVCNSIKKYTGCFVRRGKVDISNLPQAKSP